MWELEWQGAGFGGRKCESTRKETKANSWKAGVENLNLAGGLRNGFRFWDSRVRRADLSVARLAVH